MTYETPSASPTSYVPHKRIPMRTHPLFSEKWLQQQIADNPAMLGLGELEVKGSERTHPKAGRLDLLLYDAVTNTRYEVEIQLGPTDESHIIRTIEYWDIERKRYPQYDHVAVIVAEAITARFFNVIGLFANAIPMVAIQANAIEVKDCMTLVFTTVLDRIPLGTAEEDEPDEPKDRFYWENKASKKTVALADRLLGLAQEIVPGIGLKYNKHYIGLAREGVASNFLTFLPRRQHLIAQFKIPRSDEINDRLEAEGVELLTYDSHFGYYKVSLSEGDVEAHLPLLKDLVEQAHQSYGG